jgi:hypothetical protein
MGNQTSSDKLHSALNNVGSKTKWRKKLIIEANAVEKLIVTDILPIEAVQSKLYITPCGYAYDYIGDNVDVPLIDQSTAHRILLTKLENYKDNESKAEDLIVFSDDPDFTRV